eukprot:CAMPEP_0197074172 /NCGR_PEP_ID=MMETSP1384-20130603/210977_1 /TAXON_ID=29189 /ORGANISM="Ammonia sp." /LENGTH=402 /DNA_ID=CAMNT_0042513013 /DNA_START=24 /DNA_END=1229 /DNA_ORIENTATION=-
MATEKQKMNQLWTEMQPILSKQPDGIAVQAMCQQLNPHKYSAQFIQKFLQEMHAKYRLIAYLPTTPVKIKLRRGKDANKLQALDAQQYKVYNHIERAASDGILMSMLSTAAGVSSAKCTSIIKRLEKEELTNHFTNPKTLQKFYYATSYTPSTTLNNPLGGFVNERGQIDEHWLDTILTVTEAQIKQSDAVQGISALEIQRNIRASGLTKDGLPLKDIELVLQLLLYDNKVDLIASSIPDKNLSKFITHSKNTYHHLMKQIQSLRHEHAQKLKQIREDKKQSGLVNERKRKLMKSTMDESGKDSKRQRINDSTHIKIGYDEVEDGDGVELNENKESAEFDGDEELKQEMEEVRKYSQIRFRFNKYEYESPFSEIPCQSCPVASTCSDDGMINPKECPYLNAW